MSQKTYNHEPSESWTGGTGPSGEYGRSKEDFNAYLKDWDDFITKIEKITDLTVTGYDPGLNLTKIENGKWKEGYTIQLPRWFAQRLIDKFEVLNDELIEEINRE